MRSKFWLVASLTVLLLLMGIPAMAGDQQPDATMNAWLDQDPNGRLTCQDVIFMARDLLPAAAIDDFRSMSEAECVGPVESMTRREAWAILRDTVYDPNPSPSSEVIEVPLLSGYSRNSGSPVSSHTHDDNHLSDHQHGSGGGSDGIAHHNTFPQSYTFRWRHAGQAQDHFKASVRIDHHRDHFHYASGFTPTFHMSGDKHHQYRNYAAGGELPGQTQSRAQGRLRPGSTAVV